MVNKAAVLNHFTVKTLEQSARMDILLRARLNVLHTLTTRRCYMKLLV